MDWAPASAVRWLLDSEHGASDRLIPRWLFLRWLGFIYFSAFYSLIFQVRGLIGPEGILPASDYLDAVAHSLGHVRFWYAPTLLWFSSGPHMLVGLCWAGMVGSILLVLNIWPRGALAVCFLCFLSFVSAAGDFSGYQSDGMLLEAGFITLFFAPPGFRPGFGTSRPPSRASLFLLQWEWFRIYFESGLVKIVSGDPQWRNMTAMDEYYQNGPLPTWIGWYLQHLPHWFHASTAYATLALELGLVWMLFLPRRWRILCFFLVTSWQIGIILTANYTFLNYLVLALGFLSLDDRLLLSLVPQRWKPYLLNQLKADRIDEIRPTDSGAADSPSSKVHRSSSHPQLAALKFSLTGLMLGWIFYSTTVQMIWIIWPSFKLPTTPIEALDPFRIANRYGLFAVMTRGRYEIEFQGSEDASRREFTRRISRALTGTCGSPLSAHGANIQSYSAPRYSCCRTTPMYSRFLREILLRMRRQPKCAQFFGSTGSRRGPRNGTRGCGGAASFWGSMLPRSLVTPTEKSAPSNGPRALPSGDSQSEFKWDSAEFSRHNFLNYSCQQMYRVILL